MKPTVHGGFEESLKKPDPASTGGGIDPLVSCPQSLSVMTFENSVKSGKFSSVKTRLKNFVRGVF